MERSNVQPVSRVALTLGQLHEKDRFEETVKAVLRWIAFRAGRKLPPEAWGLSSFELTEIGAQHTAAVTLTDPRFWSARLDDADKHVPLRTWVTEISVGQSHDGNVLFGTNLTCVSRGDRAVFQRSVPTFVRKIATVGRSFLDNLRVETTFKFVSTISDLHHLINFLNDPNRVTDCIVVGLPDRSEDGADALIDPNALQSSLLGVSHVFVVGSEASFDLTRAVGKELSTFHSAVRLYKPGFLSLESNPYEHPLFLPKRIIEWADSGPASFSEWLIDNQLRASCRAHDSDIVPSFNSVRQIASRIEAKKLKQGGASDQELLEL